ncbi:hypothetical protein D7Y15_42450 [Corallococcus sp. AB030]|uniref:hypothetical protein n=1 Tax=unclassified Corallococcus TaxID=2685029 RepID=UPI000EC51A05|nr:MULTISPECIES: hypothetical protein [unclassified Corallococcus]RKH94788.1 hypothetical protein D7Y15_42450 [Corallococcus sp. AB030]RUO87196.1 hypothetical protein D7Y11_41965 [Corallococcus sp. AB018]
MRNLPVLLLLGLAGLAAGCATPLSTMQTAKTLSPGQVQVTGSMGVFVPVGTLASVVDVGIDQGLEAKRAIEEDRPYNLTEEDQQRLLTAGLALAVAPPGVNPELMVRVGLLDGFDVGGRYNGNALRFDGKVRLAHGGPGPRRSYDLALGLGVSKYLFSGAVMDVLEVVQLGDFSRTDVEVPLYLSAEYGDVFKLYGAPKYVFSHTRLDAQLVDFSQQGKPVTGFDASLPSVVNSHFVGSTVGFAVGYKYVHFYAELTGGYVFCNPHVFGQKRDLGGMTFLPSVGLGFRAPERRPAASVNPAAPGTVAPPSI